MEKFLKTLVIVFVCSTVLMSTVFVFVTIIPETKNTSNSDWIESEKEDEFSIYENTLLGFKIEYPKEFEYKEILNDTSYEIIDSKTKQVLVGVSDRVEFSSDLSKFYKSSDVPFSFRVKIHESLSTIEEMREMVENNPPFPLETTRLGGVEAWGGIIGNESDFHDAYSILAINQDKTYSIFFVYPKDQVDRYMPIIDHITHSFEFAKI